MRGKTTPTDDAMATARAKGKEAKARSHDVEALLAEFGLDSKMGPAQLKAIAKRTADMPVSFRRRYLRAMKGRSITTAVKAQCFECHGWDRDGPEQCTAPACPLFPYRPGA